MEFIAAESGSFHDREAEFVATWGVVIQYRKYLELLRDDHVAAAEPLIESVNARLTATLVAGESGSRQATAGELALLARNADLHLRVRMTIESIYLFVRILLDRTAKAIRMTFRPARGVRIESHSKLAENLPAYAEALGLELPRRLYESAVSLKEEEAWFRDWKIAHESDPRVMWGFAWSLDSKTEGFLSAGLLYPRPDDEDAVLTSKTPTAIIDRIDEYLGLVLDFLVRNREHFAAAPGGGPRGTDVGPG